MTEPRPAGGQRGESGARPLGPGLLPDTIRAHLQGANEVPPRGLQPPGAWHQEVES
jgi:hypothetical protein